MENPAQTPKGNAARILFDMTTTDKGVTRRNRSLADFEVYELGQGSWAFYAVQIIAPQETFKQDLPAMLAQILSVKENAAVIAQKTHEQIAANNRLFQAQQAAIKQKQASFDSYMKDVQHNQLINDRSFANWDEIIIGTRDVEDTATGQKTSVNLGDVHQVVNNLNASDPGRYKEIPLRDEMYPLPGHEKD